MAKISANGATKLAERRRPGNPSSGEPLARPVTVTVLCSDGRVLSRLIFSDGTSSGYHVAARIRNARAKSQIALLDVFHAYCDRRNYDPRVGQRDLSKVDVYRCGSHLESSVA
jgi:hypothetical protein